MKDYVWYAGYGSNLFKERFHCYIRGGKPEGSNKTEKGCRDQTLPIEESPFVLNYELYFAKKSTRWEGGGMGFVRTESNSNIVTFANMYLITIQQFCDVVQQENNMQQAPAIDFERCIRDGHLKFKEDGAYRTILYVGIKDGAPIFTFTDEGDFETNKPSLPYLKMIATGLQQSHNLTKPQILDFLMEKDGVQGKYIRAELDAAL